MEALRTIRWTYTCSMLHRTNTADACASLACAPSPESANAACQAVARIRFCNSSHTIGSIQVGSLVNPQVMLYDRDSGFLILMPRIQGQVRKLTWRERRA